MGNSSSTATTGSSSTTSVEKTFSNDPRFDGTSATSRIDQAVASPPPKLAQAQSLEQRFYDKVMKQPLVPIGCCMTAYFLMSGLKSFRNRDPRRAQKMMRARVGAQFFTLVAFVGYVGLDSFNFDVAPAYYRRKEIEEKVQRQQQQADGAAAVTSGGQQKNHVEQ